MGLKPGMTNNRKGRRPGSKNKKKKTVELRVWLTDFLKGKTEDLDRNWKKLNPEQKFKLFERLLAYSLPKPQTMDLSVGLDFAKMSNEDLDKVLDALISKGNHGNDQKAED